jgi:hypothetical protein
MAPKRIAKLSHPNYENLSKSFVYDFKIFKVQLNLSERTITNIGLTKTQTVGMQD